MTKRILKYTFSVILTFSLCMISSLAPDSEGTVGSGAAQARSSKLETRLRQALTKRRPLQGPFGGQWQLFECGRGAANFVDVPDGTGFNFGTRGASLFSDDPSARGAASCKFSSPADPDFECRRLQFLMRGELLERAFVRVTCIFKNSRTGRDAGGFTLRSDVFAIDQDDAHPGWFQYTIDPRNFPPNGVLESITFTRVDGPVRPVTIGVAQVTCRSNVSIAPDDITTQKGRCQDIPN